MRSQRPAVGKFWLMSTLCATLVLLFFSACRSERLYGERSKMGKAYHNFTAHFNGHFNANELLEEAETQLLAETKPNFTEILPVYPAYTSSNPTAAAPLLDKAMEKVSMVVNIHRPSDYDDDSYLILGRAQLLKQDLESAQHTFEFSTKEFDPDNEAKRLRRISKNKDLKRKEREKELRDQGIPVRQKNSSAKRRKGSPSRSRSSSSKKKKPSASSRSRTSSSSRGGSSKSATSKKLPKKKGKPKTRAEMAKEQREAKLALIKEAAREEERALLEAEEAAKAATAAAAEKAAKLAAGEIVDASTALDDGEGLATASNDDKRPKHGIFVHEDARQDFDYWLARTYISRERYVDAERLLGKLARSGATFKRIRRQLPAAYADMYLRRDQLAEAVPFLEDAIALEKKKLTRAHYAFILGQVQQKLGNSGPAIASFKRVVKLKPAFDLAFNASLNVLTTEYKTGQATAASTLKELRRMSKENKYIDRRDQIFYEMADIAFASGDKEEGIAYMRESLAATTDNVGQAARGYLRLAKLFFEDEAYVLSSNYYDSTLQVLPQDDPRYAELTAYRDNLRPVAANISAISLQDSLLAFAALPENEQRRQAAQIQRDQREADLARAIAESRKAALLAKSNRSNSNSQALAATNARRANTGAGGAASAQTTFFAYDSKALRRGNKEFARRWGDRQLVDNWRTLDERESLTAVDKIDSLTAGPVIADDSAVDLLLANVPNDSLGQANANRIISDALIALGRQYRDNLQNPARAAEALKELLRRYPESSYAAEALYLLGLASDEIGATADANNARQQLKRDHPESKYARSLMEANFFDEAKGAERRLIDYYDLTYDAFQKGDVVGAKDRIQSAEKEFGSNHALVARFALLNAMVVGKADGRDPYIESLKALVAKYPSSVEATKAKDILRLLGERAGATAALDKAANTTGAAQDDASNFEFAADQPHYFLAALPDGTNMSEARAKASDYNGEFHRLDKLVVGNVFMVNDGQQTGVLVVRRFDNMSAAMNYYAGAVGKSKTFLGGVTFDAAVISQNNYREVLRNKSFGQYMQFFAENYL